MPARADHRDILVVRDGWRTSRQCALHAPLRSLRSLRGRHAKEAV